MIKKHIVWNICHMPLAVIYFQTKIWLRRWISSRGVKHFQEEIIQIVEMGLFCFMQCITASHGLFVLLFNNGTNCTYHFTKTYNNCVVIFFWSSGIMECTCMLFTLEHGVPLMCCGASVVWHHSLLLMNSFNKTAAAVFSYRICFLRAFPFMSFIIKLPQS